MKSWHLVIIGLLCGLLAAGIILLINSPSRGKPVKLPPAPEQAQIAVDVGGAVNNPGVSFLDYGSRVEDAIHAAGGFSTDAFNESLNMAALLSDGSKVLVPKKEEPSSGLETVQNSIPEEEQTSFPININTAPQEVLMELPGIGEIKAQAIIDFRNQNGPFTTPEQIMDVKGIGPATFEKLKDLIIIY